MINFIGIVIRMRRGCPVDQGQVYIGGQDRIWPGVGCRARVDRLSYSRMMMIMNTPVRVFIADDQPQVRSALRLILENQETAWDITGEAADTCGLLTAVQQRQADLILLDWELPGLCERDQRDRTATELVTRLRACGRPVIIAISGYCESRQQACAAGVDAFISKTEPPDRFLAALCDAVSERIV